MLKTPPLPIDDIKNDLQKEIECHPVVVTAPTGSGKSTQVPRWCAQKGRVLVVEPRRVACRGLAQRVAELDGASLGKAVGYCVRDDNQTSPDTRIVFATPGVVLRWLSQGNLGEYDTAIIDEFHERGLDIDLILALLKKRFSGRLAVMSATMNAERVARYLEGVHIHAEARLFPVDHHHIPGKAMLPDTQGLEERIRDALTRCIQVSGDVLVFLPGKAEIAGVAESLKRKNDLEVLTIHGGLSLKEQSRVFETGQKRRVILATNVAETSITIPNVGVVVDSGLVRRTRYINGRGFLTLVPLALDSADQRAGRAGRTGPGVCYRLWSKDAVLDKVTPPEIYRESLTPLLLAAGACSAPIDTLSFLDPPKDYAVEEATNDLSSLGALGQSGHITDRGTRLFGMPLDPGLGNLLVEAEKEGCIEDAIDIVSVLSVGRPIFLKGNRPLNPEDDLKNHGCDCIACISALHSSAPGPHKLNRYVLDQARAIQKRLRKAWGLPALATPDKLIDKTRLALAGLRADPRSAYVARRRKGRVFWGNGGTEVALARESAVDEDKTEAILVLASMAVGLGYRSQHIFATSAMPLKLKHLVEAGLGVDRVKHAGKEGGAVKARIERVYAGKVLEKREEIPKGALAREAIADLFMEGRLFPGSLEKTQERLDAAALVLKLKKSRYVDVDLHGGPYEERHLALTVEDWVKSRLSTLGVTSGEDLGLLSASDLLAFDLPIETRDWLDREFPRTLSLGDAMYQITYDLKKQEATLVKVSGKRKDPPSLATIPPLRGFRVKAQHHSRVWVLREKR